MTIPNKIVELAVEGGLWIYPSDKSPQHIEYLKKILSRDGTENNHREWILTLSFWKSLRKSLNAPKEVDSHGKKPHPSRSKCNKISWEIFHAHQLFDLLLTGGNTDQFWKDLVDKK